MEKPILITLTAPSCAGKSYLFNYIRDVAGLPCLISTTTRPARKGEIEGVDYFFISKEQSLAMEERDEFAELAIYRGVRYGVTKTEFHSKLAKGVAFLIVEPSGIEHYVKPAIEIGAIHLKYYIHTDFDVRLERFKLRALTDIKRSMVKDNTDITITSYLDRLNAMLTVEQQWGDKAKWDRILFGKNSPEINLNIIMKDVTKRKSEQFN